MTKYKFNSIKEWRDYCFSTHSLYLKSPHFKKWSDKKEIYIFNFSNLKNKHIDAIKLGIGDAIKIAKLNFKIRNSKKSAFQANFLVSEINSDEILRSIIRKRKQSRKENASIFIFNKPIKSANSIIIIRDGEALTYVSEGVILFTFEPSISYPIRFLRQRAKHEALHLLGLNVHHEDTEVMGYKNSHPCVMEYNAPTIRICGKCSDAIRSFWKGIHLWQNCKKEAFLKEAFFIQQRQ